MVSWEEMANASAPRTTAAGPGLSAFCPQYHAAIELIGRRWTGAILRALLSGLTRYNEIAAAIPGLSDRLLSERLRELEHEGIVERTVIPDMPVRIEYRPTEQGRALASVVEVVSNWADEWRSPPGACADAS